MADPKPTDRRKYNGWTSERRHREGVRLVVEEGWSRRQAADLLEIGRVRLGSDVKAFKAKQAEQEARSAAALQHRLGPEREAETPVLRVENEVRRIPPIGEFVRMYFDGLKCPKHGVHHDIKPYQDEIMEKVVDPSVKRLLVNVPPGHSKSTCGTVFTTIYDVCRDPNIQIALISGTTRMAGRFLRQVKQYLTDPIHYKDSTRNLIDDWGPFVDSRGNLGSASEFYVAGRQSAQKDPTVSAYGLGQQIQGSRIDRIIGDDVQLIENSKTPERIEDLLEVITQDWMTRLDETGELALLGTRVKPADVYSFLFGLPSFEVIKYPCVLDQDAGKVLWPEHFNFEAAERQRGSMTAERWELVFQNSELAGIGASFTPEQLERCRDQDRQLGEYPPNCVLVAGLDPAGANAQAGYTAMVLMAIDVTTGVYHLVDLINHKQMKASQILDQIKDWATKYPLRELRVETNGLQAQLFQYNLELQAFLGHKGIRLAPHITHGRNKWDPQFGVESMAPLIHNQVMTIPWGSLWSRRQFQLLEDQLVRFPAGKPDDLVMAMWFAYLGCKEYYQRQAMPMFDNSKSLPGRVRAQRRVVDFGAGGVRAPTLEELNGGDMLHPGQGGRQRHFENVGGIAVY